MENKNNPEEVEIGKLFILIGDAFNTLLKKIGKGLKKIGHLFVLSLIFLKKNAIVLGVSAIIGGVLGYVLQNKNGDDFNASMIVETNFGSGHQIYKQADFINNLISQEEYKKLSEVLNISEKEAASLNGVKANPYLPNENILKEYDYFIQNTDTIYTRDITIEDFKNRYSDPDYRIQQITISGKDKNVFPKLNDDIINLIENDHFKQLLSIKNDEINKRKAVIKHELAQIDSVRKVYKEVALLNARKKSESSANNINLLEKSSNVNKDIDLFKQTSLLLSQLKDIDNDKMRNTFITKTISQLNVGEKPTSVKEKKWFKFAITGFILALLALLGLRLNAFLNTYDQKK